MIEQIGIAITGVTAIFLTQSKHEYWRRYACIFGLVGQPFWIYSAIAGKQWGILLLTAFYTAAWAKGVWTHWISRSQPAQHPLSLRCAAMSEGRKLTVFFESNDEAYEAHKHVASIKLARGES